MKNPSKPELIKITGRKNYREVGLFRCYCGTEFEFYTYRVERNYKKSCGCLKNMPSYTTHNMSYTREYRIWDAMKRRCSDAKRECYKNYGGRGIQVCDRWKNSFQNFIDDMGMPPTNKHTLDRIDSDGNYEPANCKWSTMLEQQRNRRNTLFVIVDGSKLRLTEYAEQCGMTYSAAYMKLYRNNLKGVVKA